MFNLFRGYRAFRRGFLTVTLVEAVDSSSSVDQFLLASEKWMAGRAYFDVEVALFGGSRLKRLAAGASHCNFDIFGVNSWFHALSLRQLDRQLFAVVFKQSMIEGRMRRRQVNC